MCCLLRRRRNATCALPLLGTSTKGLHNGSSDFGCSAQTNRGSTALSAIVAYHDPTHASPPLTTTQCGLEKPLTDTQTAGTLVQLRRTQRQSTHGANPTAQEKDGPAMQKVRILYTGPQKGLDGRTDASMSQGRMHAVKHMHDTVSCINRLTSSRPPCYWAPAIITATT